MAQRNLLVGMDLHASLLDLAEDGRYRGAWQAHDGAARGRRDAHKVGRIRHSGRNAVRSVW
jgi:hypothetical protein